MIILYPTGPRRDWYDRNLQADLQTWEQTQLGPHSLTDRVSYTVPAGKKAIFQAIQATAVRWTAATSVQRTYLALAYDPGSGLEYLITKRMVKNNVGDTLELFVPELGPVPPGSVLKIQTGDLSTGGTIDYQTSFTYILFDA